MGDETKKPWGRLPLYLLPSMRLSLLSVPALFLPRLFDFGRAIAEPIKFTKLLLSSIKVLICATIYSHVYIRR